MSTFYRKATWYVKGLNEFTKKGYDAASKTFNASDLDVNLAGKSYMITGSNSGIGKVAATAIAKKGGTIHMVCRSKERADAAMEEIKEASGNQDVHVHILDLSRPKQVAQFAQEFVQSGQPLDVLVNNAGCMVNAREINEDGLEKNFATNTLGTHILTLNLIPALQRQNKPRVITVSSGGMLTMKLDPVDLSFENMRPFDGVFAYAQNKRQQIVMAEQYAKQYPNIHFSTMHPGWADTPAVRSSMGDFFESHKSKFRTAEEGADTIVWLAIADAALACPSGEFFLDRKVAPKHLPLAWTKSKPQDEKKLMDRLEELKQKFRPDGF